MRRRRLPDLSFQSSLLNACRCVAGFPAPSLSVRAVNRVLLLAIRMDGRWCMLKGLSLFSFLTLMGKCTKKIRTTFIFHVKNLPILISLIINCLPCARRKVSFRWAESVFSQRERCPFRRRKASFESGVVAGRRVKRCRPASCRHDLGTRHAARHASGLDKDACKICR